jgi:MYXO-CTERM domain-containing protein
MTTGASQQDTDPDGVDPDAAPKLAADRPYVDGTASSPDELRAEVERLSNEDLQHVDDLREEVGASVAELASRLDVKARVAERKDDAVAAAHQQVDRARAVAAESAVAAKDTARQNPGLVAGAAAALVVLFVLLLRRRRR